MKNISRLLQCFMVVSLMGAMTFFSTCNSKEEEVKPSVASGTVAVTAFSLSADLKVMQNLDSVFFSIDLDHGVIFNADSLPKGTNVTKLIPKITYPSTVSSAIISMNGGSHRTGTVDYRANPNDTIDFTGNVTLTLKNTDGSLSKTYELKVNVHKMDPDLMYWEKLASTSLPSRLSAPKAQKTLQIGETIYSAVMENDGTYTIAVTSDIFNPSWNKSEWSPAFTPRLETLCAAGSRLYVLDDTGRLHSSADGNTWSDEPGTFSNLIGDYNGHLLAIVETASGAATRLLGDIPVECNLPAEFPTEGFSAPFSLTSDWLDEPVLSITGGKTADGNFSGATWAFDGHEWAEISNAPLPGLYAPQVFQYYSCLKGSDGSFREFKVLMAFGGELRDGTLNEITFISYNGGISWQKATDSASLPASIPALYGADIVVASKSMQANLSDNWKRLKTTPKRLPYEIDGDLISWDCPYIFMFGGYTESGKLSADIYSGLLRRLSFTPLF